MIAGASLAPLLIEVCWVRKHKPRGSDLLSVCSTDMLTTVSASCAIWRGMGCEDLEGCEQLFAHTNHLAASVRYASAFH